MFTQNPFAVLSASVPPAVTQSYVAVMIVFVVAGTLFDMQHKRSATYFFRNWREARSKARHTVGSGTIATLAVRTLLVDWLASAEFCSARRRAAHLLTMYGFLAYALSTAVMVFAYPTAAMPTPAILPVLWYAGALMICLGGYWFWFFIRVDVAAEGNSPWRIVRADLFVLSLVSSATLGIAWAVLQSRGSAWTSVLLGLYLVASTTLFVSVPWSKFSHMFYKPAAAFQKRVEEADGSRSGLPLPAGQPDVLGTTRRNTSHY